MRITVKRQSYGCENLTDLKYRWDAVMDGITDDVANRRYEEAEKRVGDLIDLDTRILRAVNCAEASKP